MERLPIPRASTAMIFNDMINANVRGSDPERTRLIEQSGLIETSVRLVAKLRRLDVPIFWIRVERRADRKDRVNTLTDSFVSAGRQPRPPVVKGSPDAQNITELPIQADDHEVLKPRYNPFIGTDLDLQLRARGLNTILLGGISTNMGVESCARTAHDLDYNVVVLSDCCFHADAEMHNFALTKVLGHFARVMETDEALDLLK